MIEPSGFNTLYLFYRYLRPVQWFIKEELELSFFEVSYIAKLKGQLAFGYKLRNGEMFINPRDKNKVVKWKDGDVLLLLALN